MKTSLILVTLGMFAGASLASALASEELVGRWITIEIENFEERPGIGTGWTLEFFDDGSFTEEKDSGFRVVEESRGNYTADWQTLALRREGLFKSADYTFAMKGNRLVIVSKFKEKKQYKATFERSDKEHPDLAKLPKIPKTKKEAVSVLREKLSDSLREEIRAKPKDGLIEYHFGLGMYVRNAFGLWGRNEALVEDMSGGERIHPDTLSGLLIDALWNELQKEREDYEEFVALTALYDSMEIDALPIRNLTPTELISKLNENVDTALRGSGRSPQELELVLMGENSSTASRLNSLPLLKVWGREIEETVLLKRCLSGFTVALKTPNTLEISPMNGSGWYTRGEDEISYRTVMHGDDHFDVVTEVSDSASHIHSGLPGVYRESRWYMEGRESWLELPQIVELFREYGESNADEKLMEVSSGRSGVEETLEVSYRVSSYLRPVNDYKPTKFEEYGHLYFDDGKQLFAATEPLSFDERSLWKDSSLSPRLSREGAVQVLREYLKAEFGIEEEAAGATVSLQRVNLTEYWIYEIRMSFGEESPVLDLRAFVTLSGEVVPFRER